VRLTGSQVQRLEELRESESITHHDLALFILSHPATGRMAVRRTYELLRAQQPATSEEEILLQVIFARAAAAVATGSDLFDLSRFITRTRPELDYIVASEIREVMADNDLRDIKDVMAAIEQSEMQLPDTEADPQLRKAVERAAAIIAESER
jgi:hypothetical protein